MSGTFATKHMYHIAIKCIIWIHNFVYRALSVLVLKAHDGIHPKHDILNYKKFFVDHIKTSDVVLDVGCGNGALAFAIAQKAQQVCAIDIVKKNIHSANKKFAHDNITYVLGDATTHHFDQNFDVVTLSNVLEHIDDRVTFLKKVKKLAPTFLIRVPLITRDWLAVYKKQQGLEYRLDKTHYIEYTNDTLAAELEHADLVITEHFVQFGELYAVVTHR